MGKTPILFAPVTAMTVLFAAPAAGRAADGGRTSQETSSAGRSSHAGASARPGPAYRIGPGDVLAIHVWKEPDASVPQVVVRSDGKISLSLVKEVQAAGLSPSELEEVLLQAYSRFIREPEVTVLVKEIHSERIYVVGAVRKEGAIRLQPPMTVLQAIAEAGGLTEFAKKKKIYVLRTEKHKQVRLFFNYDAVIRGDRLEQNFLLSPGDTVVVPQ